MPSTRGGSEARCRGAGAAGHGAGTWGFPWGGGVHPRQALGGGKGGGNSLQKRPVWKEEWLLSACLQPDMQVLIQAGSCEMQSKGEESQASPRLSKTQAKSKDVWEIGSSRGAWVVWMCVAVCLNCLPHSLKKCAIFIVLSLSSGSLIASTWVSPGLIFPRCAPTTSHTHFPLHGAWWTWLCPLQCSGSSGTPPKDSSGGQLHSSLCPAQTGCADPTALSTHIYNHFKQEKCYPKLLPSAWEKAMWGNCYCKGLRGSWHSGSTAAARPQHLWARRSSH